MKVLGSRALGARLHQWHVGMDAVYAAGSTFFARGEADSKTVEDALWILRRERKNVTGAALRSLNATIRALETALERAKRKALRLRTPGAKGRRLASSSRARTAASRQHRARKANPGGAMCFLRRPLSHGFYRITDAQAGMLASVVKRPLPGHGRELRVEVPGVGLRWLTRTPYSPNNWTDAPARGWVWAIH